MKKILFILLLFNFSCLQVEQSPENNYVVEAYVYTGERVNDITLKTLVSLDNPEGESIMISNGTVKMVKNDREYDLTYNQGTNKYEIQEQTLNISPGDDLFLEVNVDGRESAATTTVPSFPKGLSLSKDEMIIPEIKSAADFIGNDPLADAEIIMDWDNPANELHYVVIEFRSNLLRPILPPDVQEVVDGILEDFAIITPPDTVSSYTITGALLPSYGPYIARLYKVNQEYADLFESEEQDSRDLNDPPSNIINARGIFTAFSSDSLSFEIIKP